MRVLLADDEPDIRYLYRQMLEGCGYQVDEAADGREVLELIEGGTFDLVIMDLYMPNVDGFEAIGLIRAKDSQVPIIVMTGHYPERVVSKRIKGLGVNKVLRKPVMITSLMTAVREVAGAAA
jgi:CheY-like chemotaxis protein